MVYLQCETVKAIQGEQNKRNITSTMDQKIGITRKLRSYKVQDRVKICNVN